MPEISRFYGIVIKMFYDEHAPPHFHAEYGDDSVIVDIDKLAAISGKIKPRAFGLDLVAGKVEASGHLNRPDK
ncbi:MAG: DUF4160 domain-containing protein [Pseudomonadota bacterium]